MTEETKEKVNLLKRDFRAMMNGPVSASLREKGLNYRVIFGVEWPRLVDLARGMEKNHDLAQALWKEDIRECRLLAGLLQPVETFFPEIADIWVESMRYPEEAQYTVMSLFQHLPYASDKAFEWVAGQHPMFQLCGWLLMARLFMRGVPLNRQSEDEFVDQAEAALASDDPLLRRTVRNAVYKYALVGEREKLRVGKILEACNF